MFWSQVVISPVCFFSSRWLYFILTEVKRFSLATQLLAYLVFMKLSIQTWKNDFICLLPQGKHSSFPFKGYTSFSYPLSDKFVCIRKHPRKLWCKEASDKFNKQYCCSLSLLHINREVSCRYKDIYWEIYSSCSFCLLPL